MRPFFLLAALAWLASYTPASAADPERVGSLIRVPIEEGKKAKAVEANVNDLLQFELGYPVVPDRIVSELKLELSGKGLTRVATVYIPKRAENGQVVVGAMVIAGFVRADAPGNYAVKIVPRLTNGKEGVLAEFTVKVAKE